jgi:hypothetical protein
VTFDAHKPVFTILLTDMSWNNCMEFIAMGDAVSAVKSMQKVSTYWRDFNYMEGDCHK